MLTTLYDMYAIHSFMAWNTYTIGAGTCYPSGAPEFIVCHFVLFLWSLNCLSFFLQLLITPSACPEDIIHLASIYENQIEYLVAQ